ncbi:MAG: carbohydrate binding domain-containing protein, partial [Clostridia bacterium]|nr:carbohydrate binding domain-containing protein [Clostridia bacterium]
MNMRKIIAVLSAVLMLCAIIPMGAVSVSAAEEVAYLADFEDGKISGWYTSGSGEMSVVSTSELPAPNPNGGNYVMKKVQPVGEYSWQEYQKGFNVEANTDYVVSVDVLTTSNNWPIQAFVSTGTWITGQLGSVTVKCASNQWHTLTFNFNSGNNTKLFCSVKSQWENTTLYIDNFKIAKLDPYRELVKNGGFEDGTTTGWSVHETVTVEAAAAHDGNYGLHMKDRGTWGGIMNQTFAVEAGKSYDISFWIKVNKFGVNLQIQDDNGSLATGTWYDYNSHSEWTLKTYTVIPTTNNLTLNFCGGGDSGTANPEKETDTYIDSLSIKRVKDPSFDGYLYNGDFETGKLNFPTGQGSNPGVWYNLWTGTTHELVDGNNSDYALKGTANGAYSITYQSIAVEPNTDYIVSAWAKNSSNSALWIKNDGGNGDIINKNFAGTGDTWTQTMLEFNSGANSKVWIGLMGIAAGATYTVDDIVVLKKVAPSNDGYIVNGNFESGAKGNFSMDQQTAVTMNAAKDGNFGAELKGSGWGGLLGYTFDVEPGATYVLSYDAIALTNGFNSAVLADTWKGEKLANKTFSSTSWTTINLEFVATTNKCYLNLNGYSETGAVHCYVDNVRVVKTKDAHICNVVEQERVDATCTTDGYVKYACDCGLGEYTETITAKGHTAGAAADCENAQVCTVCGAELTAALGHIYDGCEDTDCDVCGAVRDNVGHTLAYVGAVVPANCQENGHDEYWKCTECDACFGDAEGSYQVNPAWMNYTGEHVRPEDAADCAVVPCELCNEDTFGDGEHDTGVAACQTGTCSKCNAEIEGYGCQNYDTPACQDGVCYYCGGFVAGFGHENGAWAACCDGECSYGCGLIYPATEDHVDSDADDYCDNCWNHLKHDVDPCVGGECSICWTYIEGAHTYDNEFDVDCNACGDIREASQPITNGGTSAMEMKDGNGGVAALFNVDVEGLAITAGTATEADYTNATIGGYKLLS